MAPSASSAGYLHLSLGGYLARYGACYGLVRAAFLASPHMLTRSYAERKSRYQAWTGRRLWRKYGVSAAELTETQRNGLLPRPAQDARHLRDVVWIAWHTGFDQEPPPIVQACRKSVHAHCRGRRVIELSAANIADYLTIPTGITTAMEEGRMPVAVFYDIVRFALLGHYGGTWIDATVLLTADIGDAILDTDFFAVRDTAALPDAAEFATWILHSASPSAVFRRAGAVLVRYWNQEKHLCEYLLPSIILTAVINTEPEPDVIRCQCPDIWEAEQMLPLLSSAYDPELASRLAQLSPFHKLSYKLPKATLNDPRNVYHAVITDSPLM